MYTFLKQDHSVEEPVAVSAWPQLTPSPGVYISSLCRPRKPVSKAALGVAAGSTQPGPCDEACLPSSLTMKMSLQNNMPQPEWVHQRLSTNSVITLGLKSSSLSLLSVRIFISATVII